MAIGEADHVYRKEGVLRLRYEMSDDRSDHAAIRGLRGAQDARRKEEERDDFDPLDELDLDLTRTEPKPDRVEAAPFHQGSRKCRGPDWQGRAADHRGGAGRVSAQGLGGAEGSC